MLRLSIFPSFAEVSFFIKRNNTIYIYIYIYKYIYIYIYLYIYIYIYIVLLRFIKKLTSANDGKMLSRSIMMTRMLRSLTVMLKRCVYIGVYEI